MERRRDSARWWMVSTAPGSWCSQGGRGSHTKRSSSEDRGERSRTRIPQAKHATVDKERGGDKAPVGTLSCDGEENSKGRASESLSSEARCRSFSEGGFFTFFLFFVWRVIGRYRVFLWFSIFFVPSFLFLKGQKRSRREQNQVRPCRTDLTPLKWWFVERIRGKGVIV